MPSLVRFALAAFLVCAVRADWPQLRGPNSDGSAEHSILASWLDVQPQVIWRTPIKNGFSSFVVSSGKAVTLALREIDGADSEVCLALDANTGAEIWAQPVGVAKYTGVGFDSGNYGAPGNQGGDGPRSTPTIDDDRVFVMSSKLVLFCIDLRDGKTLWRRDLVKEFGGREISYENAASPIVVDQGVLVAGGGPGQSILCLNEETGAVVWSSHNEDLTHSTPLFTTLHGADQTIFFTKRGLLSLDPSNGKELWRYPFTFRVCAAITPVVGGSMVYCSAGYGIGSGVCEIEKTNDTFAASELWRLRRNEPVASYWSTPIYLNGHLYGMFGFKKFHTAPLKCVELATGAVKWEEPGFGHGSIIRVGEMLLAQAGHGEITLIRPTPADYRERGRFKALSGKCWSTPAFSAGRLYLRSTTEGVCLQLPVTGENNLASNPFKTATAAD